MDALDTAGLSKSYGRHDLPVSGRIRRAAPEVHALTDLSIAVHEGEIFGFLGPNGAGKSTTIRLLLGYLHPTSGAATVLGRDIVRDSVEIRRRVGYLPGGIALYDTLTGERLLDYLGALTGRPSIRRAELLDRLELSERTLRRPVRDYSRGMRQKIGIIQALQHDPELAILDEPTEGLDPLMQRAFYGILHDLRAAGRTIFFSSHVLSEVERVCDRVAIVRQGRLVALEDVARLLERRKRNVELRVGGDDMPVLAGVPGVSAISRTADGRLTCQLEGDVGPFLAALTGHRIVDLTIEPAHLEEAFLELYEDAEPEAEARSSPAAIVTASRDAGPPTPPSGPTR
ncbi:MAG TPA: ABC transporter ATP-binding protein [Candidatus Limnocylindrales bacterium]|jgi:ABC-2 type transport system ATP-binding protein|nr:ABC transporter ATP-binding protein [Candidatus Limnocylindrales bacterium]